MQKMHRNHACVSTSIGSGGLACLTRLRHWHARSEAGYMQRASVLHAPAEMPVYSRACERHASRCVVKVAVREVSVIGTSRVRGILRCRPAHSQGTTRETLVGVKRSTAHDTGTCMQAHTRCRVSHHQALATDAAPDLARPYALHRVPRSMHTCVDNACS